MPCGRTAHRQVGRSQVSLKNHSVLLGERATENAPSAPIDAVPKVGAVRAQASYCAKVHLARNLVVSYAANSFDFGQVAREAKLYWSRFTRVTIAPPD